MKDKVEQALAKIRPLLFSDGGDIELVSVDEACGVVRVSFKGACGCCPGAAMTLKMVVERKIKEEVPQVKKVIAI
ncbi:MAG: NifU family protein [Elusimicrobia bacterium]|nr:NifU family protein [Elusimicrobiota bacterium]